MMNFQFNVTYKYICRETIIIITIILNRVHIYLFSGSFFMFG